MQSADRVYVEFKDGERVRRIVGYDVFADVGVYVDGADHLLEPLPLDARRRWSWVRRWPRSAVRSATEPLAVGVVSATGRSIPSPTSRYSVADAIQTDAPINRGNSVDRCSTRAGV